MTHRVHNYRLMDFFQKAKSISAAFVVIGILLLALILFFRFVYESKSQPKIYRGKVVDKWLSIGETQQGSVVSRRLLIEADNGVRFKINPSVEEYDKVKVGDSIKNDGDGIKPLETPIK